MRLAFLITTCFILCIISCGPKTVYEESYTFNDNTWSYEDGKSFTFAAPDTTTLYNMSLELTHLDYYGFENLYLETATILPGSDTIKDILSLQLIADDGFWVGKGNNSKVVNTYLLQDFKFKQLGEIQLIVNQYSRENNLKGIQAVGLRVDEVVQ